MNHLQGKSLKRTSANKAAIGARLLCSLTPITLALWWGGLTVYAAVVVPLGSNIVGSSTQGFITQQVTHWLNAFAALALLVPAAGVFRSGSRGLIAVWAGLLLLLVTLAVLHTRLDAMLDRDAQSVRDTQPFYGEHRVYLFVTTAQWALGIVYLAILCGERQK